MNVHSMYNSVNDIFDVAKQMYHLGRVKLERAGQQSFPTSVCEPTGRFAGNCRAPCMCALLLVFTSIVALLADHSGSIFAFLQIIADSC